ncbi:MAG: hypothetical protein KDA58_16925, partial [Planctomycetaceae bacterium]|nr:hypothetical protein [Planctomycetaceae bacterium]
MKKKVGGGIVVAAIVLGVFLGQFWRLPGLGPNDTTAPQHSENDPAPPQPPETDVNVHVEMPSDPATPGGTGLSPSETPPELINV